VVSFCDLRAIINRPIVAEVAAQKMTHTPAAMSTSARVKPRQA